jgi:hypothetical protein
MPFTSELGLYFGAIYHKLLKLECQTRNFLVQEYFNWHNVMMIMRLDLANWTDESSIVALLIHTNKIH